MERAGDSTQWVRPSVPAVRGQNFKGALCLLASAFGFALMAFFVRLCDSYGEVLSSFQKSFFRNLIALLLAGVVFWRGRSRWQGSLLTMPWSQVTLPLVLRAVFGTIGIFANFYALSIIPIGEAMTLNKTAPLFTVLFSWLWLHERVPLRQGFWLAFAFLGAALVMKPGFRAADTFASICALGGGLAAGLAYVCVHRLGRLRVEPAFIVLFFSLFSCLASLPFLVVRYCPMTFVQLLILLGAGLGAALGQFGVTAAYRFAEPRAIAVYDYTNILFTALLGFFFFHQVPDGLSVIGFIFILLAAFAMRRVA